MSSASSPEVSDLSYANVNSFEDVGCLGTAQDQTQTEDHISGLDVLDTIQPEVEHEHTHLTDSTLPNATIHHGTYYFSMDMIVCLVCSFYFI
jgi:hypothetical protein